MSSIEFVQSSKSKTILVVDGHEYYKKREKKLTTVWICAQYQTFSCHTSRMQLPIKFWSNLSYLLWKPSIRHCPPVLLYRDASSIYRRLLSVKLANSGWETCTIRTQSCHWLWNVYQLWLLKSLKMLNPPSSSSLKIFKKFASSSPSTQVR